MSDIFENVGKCEDHHVFDEYGICFECDAVATEPWCMRTRSYSPCLACGTISECKVPWSDLADTP